jgi:hypothetical protein
MQCSFPPLLTQVALTSPQASWQKRLPPAPRVHPIAEQSPGGSPPSTTGGTPPPSARSHWLMAPLGNWQAEVPLQLAVPQQNNISDDGSHTWLGLHTSPLGQSHTDEQPPSSRLTAKSVDNTGGASPSVQPTSVSASTIPSARVIFPF